MKVKFCYFATMLVIVLTGCKETEPETLFHRSRLEINNKSSQSFIVHLDPPQGAGAPFEERISTTIEPNSVAIISSQSDDDGWCTWASPQLFGFPVETVGVLVTFCFVDEDIEHAFEGEMIQNDVREVSNWEKQTTSQGGDTVFTYTFTQEDYEEIMALYE